MRRRRKLPWIPLLLLGFLCGAGVEWLRLRPSGPFVPPLVAGIAPQTSFVRPEDQHLIRSWTLPQTVDDVTSELKKELTLGDGWQPPTVRKTDPETIQFARVRSPNGDFEFTRITLTDVGGGKTNLTVDLEPKQPHAFKS